MKKLLLIIFIVLCFGLVACADAPMTESTTTTTESTSAVATTTVTTTETTTATTETTTATTETTTETTTAEPTVDPPIPEYFIEFSPEGELIPSPDDKTCFELVTREIKMADLSAILGDPSSTLRDLCEKLPIQCVRKYPLGDVDRYLITVKTDEGWKLLVIWSYMYNNTKEYLLRANVPLIILDKDKDILIEKLKNNASYNDIEDIYDLGYIGTNMSILNWGNGTNHLIVVFAFEDGTVIYAEFLKREPYGNRYCVFKL